MNKLMGVVVGVNLAVACMMMQGCKAPKAGAKSPARMQKIEQPAPAPAPAAEPLPAPAPVPAPVAEVKPLPPPAAPVEEVKPLPAAPVTEVAPAAETTTYVVKRGDVLSKICRRNGVKQSEVLKLNPGLKADKLYVGKKIKLPAKGVVAPAKSAAPAKAEAAAPAAKKEAKAAAANVKAPVATKQAFKKYTGPTKEYVVVNGDIIGKIAYSYGISIRALKDLNGLKDNNLRIGQKLKVPAEKQVAEKQVAEKPAQKDAKAVEKKAEAKAAAPEAKKSEEKPAAPKAEEKAAAPAPAPAPAAAPKAAEAPAAAPVAAPAPAAEAAPAPAAAPAAPAPTHVVKSGEDLVTIAIRYGTSLMELKDLNGLQDENVKPGQVLKLPAGVKAQ